MHLFDLLFKGYSDARYRQNYQIDADELEILLRRVHRLHDIAERLCHRRLRAYSRQEAEGHLLPGKITGGSGRLRSEEHTSELQSLMRHSYAVFCLKKKK